MPVAASLLSAWAVLAAPYLNGVPFSHFAARALSADALAADAPLLALLAADPNTRLQLSDLVECALPPEAEVNVDVGSEVLTFRGRFGLAPEWADGPCEGACRRWSTACMATRVNAYAIPFEITGRGEAAGLPDPAGESAFTVEEGAFFGDFFSDPPQVHSCRGVGEDPLALAFRTCTLPGSRCGISVVGPCAEVCDGRTPGGGYTDCHDRLRGPDGRRPERDSTYTEVITTFLRPTSFQGGLTPDGVACDPVAPGPQRLPESEGRIGDRCASDTDCTEAPGVCFANAPGGWCTAGCEDSDDAEAEAAACGGPDRTCIPQPASGPMCTRTCTPGVAGGDCGAGRVCTLPWLSVSANAPHVAGCLPMCSDDADCNPGSFCHRRLGVCGTPVVPDGLPDGEPCDAGAPQSPCAGMCMRADANPRHGLCASLLNGAVSIVCPDADRGVVPYGPRALDDLVLCIERTCGDDTGCTAPLRCLPDRRGNGPDFCQYPTP